jgi:hypothetical protein
MKGEKPMMKVVMVKQNAICLKDGIEKLFDYNSAK